MTHAMAYLLAALKKIVKVFSSSQLLEVHQEVVELGSGEEPFQRGLRSILHF